MIEVEIKFPLIKNNEQLITADAQYLGEKKVRDVYYDNQDKDLILSDRWLRCRDGKFEFKIPADPTTKNSSFLARRYTELTSDQDILAALNLSGRNLVAALQQHSIRPFATISTTRRSYQQNDFRIDIDRTDFGYALGEVEKLVSDPTQLELTEQELKQFLAAHHIAYSQGHIGKVAHYLQQCDPDLFHRLIDAGVINHEKN